MARILFIQDNRFEYHGIEILSAVVRKNGHYCDLFITGSKVCDSKKERKLMNKLFQDKIDIVAFSISSIKNRWAFELAEKIKSNYPDILTVFGGPHPTFFPDIIHNKGVDVVCIGEGEQAFLELANKLDSKEDITNINNLWIKKDGQVFKNKIRPLIEDLDSLPFQDRSIYFKKGIFGQFPVKRFLTSRGCPYNCSFCFNKKYNEIYAGNGKVIRYRSPLYIVNEIKEVKLNYGLKTVVFTDDSFTLNKTWLLNFLELYRKEINLPFYCFTRADLINQEVVKVLKDSGCYLVCFAIESGNENIRNTVLKKNLKDSQIIEAARKLRRNKLKFMTFNMVGLPTETLQDAFKTVRLNMRIKTDIPYATLFQPIPGTDIYEYSKKRGLIPFDINIEKLDDYHFFGNKIPLQQPDAKYLPRLQKLFVPAVKFPWTGALIRVLIRFPLTWLYRVIFEMGMIFHHKVKMGLSWFEVLKIGLKIRRTVE